jgi:UDP-glucose 4-epimerase
VACRIFTAYGERENESHAVISLAAKAAARLDPFPIWGGGLQTRNSTYVQDTVTGMALGGAVLEGFDVINIGIETHYTILDLLEEIFRVVGWRPKVIDEQLDKPVGVKSRPPTSANVAQSWAGYPRTFSARASSALPIGISTPSAGAMRQPSSAC